ncbi:MAG TPA: hypothetical protein VMW08_00460 [Acidimicrobiales bacterium]|nr:hypothetical protein [Acidimicrobiales bacterium]
MTGTLIEDDEPERPEGLLEVGLWCNVCLLPSAAVAPVTLTAGPGGRVIGQMVVTICLDCGAVLDGDGNPKPATI